MDNDSQRKMILGNNLWKVMFTLSWPAVIAMVLYGLNTIFDAIFVGRYVGETALAGISLAYPLTQIPLGIGSLIGVGAGSALSIAIGANDRKTQRALLGNVNLLIIVFSIVFAIIGIVLTKPMVRLMGGSGDELVYGANYFRITLYGAVFWVAGLAYNMIVRAEGKMKSAAVMMGTGLAVNIISNYILIVIFDMGVEGAAWGTNIGMVVYTLVFILYVWMGKATFDVKFASLSRNREVMKKILSMGMPSFIMTVMFLIQGAVVLNALSSYGTTTDIAFYGVVFRIFNFMLTPIYGLMRALQPVIGINYGAKQYQRVISSFKIFAVAAMLILLPFWIFMMIFPELFLNMMLPDTSFGSTDYANFRIFTALLPVMPVIFMALTFFPAIDKAKSATIMGIARQLVFYVPVMLILPRFFGVRWVYIGSFLIDLIIIIWVLIIVRKEFNHLRKNMGVSVHNSIS
jgi:putative MATE family efflux protein